MKAVGFLAGLLALGASPARAASDSDGLAAEAYKKARSVSMAELENLQALQSMMNGLAPGMPGAQAVAPQDPTAGGAGQSAPPSAGTAPAAPSTQPQNSGPVAPTPSGSNLGYGQAPKPAAATAPAPATQQQQQPAPPASNTAPASQPPPSNSGTSTSTITIRITINGKTTVYTSTVTGGVGCPPH